MINLEQKVRECIDTTIHLSLATVDGGMPLVCEVHFAYDDQLNLYFRSLTSRRHSQEIAKNPQVAGNIIDKHGVEDMAVGLYFEGSAEIVTDKNEQKHAATTLIDRLKITKDILGEAEDEDGHQFYKINVENWYVFGDFDGKGATKHKLRWDNSAES